MLESKKHGMMSFSQSGEDMIINFIFTCLGINNPSYIDIGAHDPFKFSNTAYFYNKGSRGINIDANPVCIEKFKKYRKNDINLNVGIGSEDQEEMTFYVMDLPTMSSFSKEQAELLVKNHGMKIVREIPIKVVTIKSIVDEYNNGKFPDILTIDAEGMDFDILKSIDLKVNRPIVICIETAKYGNTISTIHKGEDLEMHNYLIDNDYVRYANTGINSIYVQNGI